MILKPILSDLLLDSLAFTDTTGVSPVNLHMFVAIHQICHLLLREVTVKRLRLISYFLYQIHLPTVSPYRKYVERVSLLRILLCESLLLAFHELKQIILKLYVKFLEVCNYEHFVLVFTPLLGGIHWLHFGFV